jgi:hypothetical protein
VSTSGRALSVATFGAWLVKARPDGLPLEELVRSGFASLTGRCVRPTYRTGLIREGQPVLLWVSGHDPEHPAGIYAAGATAGPVTCDGSEHSMPLRLRSVDPVVSRQEILAHPALSRIEVVVMPAGSNPSYLDSAQYQALVESFPQVV